MWKALIKWVESWSYRCEHDWVFHDKAEYFNGSYTKMPNKISSVYRCKKCCESKKITM